MSSNSRNDQPGGESAEREILIGRIVSVNIPKRQLRISPATSHPERFNELRELRLRTKEGRRVSLAILGVRVVPGVIIARVESNEDAEIALSRGADVVVPLSERFRLPENEYYVDDLIGLIVKDTEGKVIGRLTEIWETPAHDIYQVLDDAGHEILLPAIDDVILNVDIAGGELVA
ncbi:MAG: 16S rRNA processing protein RimM, partial [Candidatus Lindowbacteria bacterium]|nr:16S rRNA processing protein RimM [Candidatus Lindowbacteria bacterium]